jgi:hypothetical protein
MSSLTRSPNNSLESVLVKSNRNLVHPYIKTILLPVGIALSLSIFVATFFEIYSSYQAQRHINGFVISIGAGVFFVVMTLFHYLPQNNGSAFQQLAKAATLASAGTTLFIALLWFLALNTIVERSFA